MFPGFIANRASLLGMESLRAASPIHSLFLLPAGLLLPPPSSLCIPASRHLPWGWHLSPPEVPRAHPCWCLSPAWAEPWLWLLSLGLARKFASCHIIPLVDPVGSCLCLCKWWRRNPCGGETCGQIATSFSSLVLPTQLGSPGCLLRGCLCQRRWQSVIRERVTPSLALSWDRADHSPCPHS